MGQGIFDGFDDGPVQFGVLALHLEPDLLAAAESQIPHRAGKFAPDVADRLHAGFHDFFLQFGGDEIHALGNRLKSGVLQAVGKLQQLVARQHQFAHQIHQPVQQGHAHADGFHRRVRIARLHCLLRREHVLRTGRSVGDKNLANLLPALFLHLQGQGKIFGAKLPALDEDSANFGRRQGKDSRSCVCAWACDAPGRKMASRTTRSCLAACGSSDGWLHAAVRQDVGSRAAAATAGLARARPANPPAVR